MRDDQILIAAIKKAADSGLDLKKSGAGTILLSFSENRDELIWRTSVHYGLIFSHAFAKAFWPDEIAKSRCCNADVKDDFVYPNLPSTTWYRCLKCNQSCAINTRDVGWQAHLKEMVLEENPLKYLEQFL